MSTESTPEDQSTPPPPPESANAYAYIGTLSKPQEPVFFRKQGVIALPEGWSLENVEKYMDRPVRARTQYRPADIKSLVFLLKRFGDDQETLIAVTRGFSNPNPISLGCLIKAYFEAGTLGDPGHMTHSAELELALSKPFNSLMQFYMHGGDHKSLVRLLDDLLMYLSEPDAGTIMDSLHKLSLVQEAKFTRAENLQNGDVAISYETLTGASTASGRVRLPDRVVFVIPVFKGLEATWRVAFQLRYVFRDQNVKFSLSHPDIIDAIESDFFPSLDSELQHHCGSFPAFAGSLQA